MSKQVLDIKQMQHLKRLGVDTDKATMAYIINITDKYKPFLCLSSDAIDHVDFYNCALGAFTLQDILDLLPKSTKYGQLQIRFCEYPNGNYGNEVVYDSMAHNGITFFCENVIDSAYEMLCFCIKEGYIKTNKEN